MKVDVVFVSCFFKVGYIFWEFLIFDYLESIIHILDSFLFGEKNPVIRNKCVLYMCIYIYIS